MTTRALTVITVVAVAFASVVAMASLYGWNDAKRPPISLTDALARAEKLLGDDAANRYCVSVSLHGDEAGEGTEGAWNLLFAAADGSKKLVYINMQGKSEVRAWNGPIDWKKNEGRRADLADVRRRLEDLLAKEGIKAEFQAQQDRLQVTYKAREFQIYPRREDGSYGAELEKVSGPEADGIWLQVQVVDKPDHRQYMYPDGPYWSWSRGTYFLTAAGKFLAIDMRYGPNFKYDIARQIWDVFGERTKD